MSTDEEPRLFNGGAREAANPSPKAIGIDDIVARLQALEARLPEAVEIVKSLTRHHENMQAQQGQIHELSSAVKFLTTQRSVAELQMERNTRAMALDLAIKAAPPKSEQPIDGTKMVALAQSFLDYIRGADQDG